jgi:hypothetical protein
MLHFRTAQAPMEVYLGRLSDEYGISEECDDWMAAMLGPDPNRGPTADEPRWHISDVIWFWRILGDDG